MINVTNWSFFVSNGKISIKLFYSYFSSSVHLF